MNQQKKINHFQYENVHVYGVKQYFASLFSYLIFFSFVIQNSPFFSRLSMVSRKMFHLVFVFIFYFGLFVYFVSLLLVATIALYFCLCGIFTFTKKKQFKIVPSWFNEFQLENELPLHRAKCFYSLLSFSFGVRMPFRLYSIRSKCCFCLILLCCIHAHIHT